MRPLLLALSLLLLGAAAPAAAEEFKVVVHPDNPVAHLSQAQVSRLFLKKTLRWPEGRAVHPVEPTSPRLRERFALSIHEKSLNAVKSYWNQLIFSGREVPPVSKSTDADVIAFVRSNPGALGYVSASTEAHGVKTVALKD